MIDKYSQLHEILSRSSNRQLAPSLMKAKDMSNLAVLLVVLSRSHQAAYQTKTWISQRPSTLLKIKGVSINLAAIGRSHMMIRKPSVKNKSKVQRSKSYKTRSSSRKSRLCRLRSYRQRHRRFGSTLRRKSRLLHKQHVTFISVLTSWLWRSRSSS